MTEEDNSKINDQNDDQNNNIPVEPKTFREIEVEDTTDDEKIDKKKKRATLKKRLNIAKKAGKITAAYPVQLAVFLLYKFFTYALNLILTFVLIGVITGIGVGVAFIMYVSEYVDPEYKGLENLQMESAQVTTIYDASGSEENVVTLHGTENRLWASYSEIESSDYLIDAFVAIEDKRFFEHTGVDYKRTGNAIINFFLPSGDNSGGSTITQQLIKTVSKNDETTIQRKIQEILRAFNVESKYTKEEILEMYLNMIYLSQNTNGVKVAARTYFGKSLDELTLVECAALASIPKSPTKYDPVRNPQHNLARRNLVLEQMLEQGKITQEEFDEAYDKVLELNTAEEETYTEKIHSYFVDALLDEVVDDLCEEYGYDKMTASRLLYSGGLTIYSTCDKTVQDSMEYIFEDDSDKYLSVSGSTSEDVAGVKPQAAMVIMNPQTGDVLGVVGGRGEKKESRGFNRATQSRRQCGSSIKPLSIYSLALEKGLLTYGTMVDDIPTMKNDKGKLWPGNTPSGFYGMVSVNFAVMKSLNTVPVVLVNQLTPQTSFNFLKDSLGFESIIQSEVINGTTFSDVAVSPLALGSFTHGVTVLEMAAGYTMLANSGRTSSPRFYTKITDPNGTIILEKSQEHKYAISEENACVMTCMLENVADPDLSGTANYLTFGEEHDVEYAGKTGSTNDDRDRYYVGYTPDYVGAVWFGYDNNKSLVGFFRNPAAALWDHVMKRIYDELDAGEYPYQTEFYKDVKGASVIEVEYCTVSGKLPTELCSRDEYCYVNGGNCIEKGWFVRGTEPTTTCDSHIELLYDTTTGGLCLEGCNCPEANLKKVVYRVNSSRVFDASVFIKDSPYLYMDLPAEVQFSLNINNPFYAAAFPAESYFGTKSGSRPKNSICAEHYHPVETPDSDVSDVTTTTGIIE